MSDIPNNWKLANLRTIAEIYTGGTPRRSNEIIYFANGEIPWIKTMDLNNGKIITTDEKITKKALQESNCKLLPKGTVIVAMYGGFNQIGRTGMMTEDSTTNQALSSLVINNNLAINEFVLYWLNANVKIWKKFAASSRKDPNITKKDVEQFPINLPPLEEQRKIAEILSTWDEAIRITEKIITALEKRKKGLMQRLLTGQLRFPSFTEEWKEVRLGEILSINYGKSPKGIRDENGKYSVIGTSGVIDKTNTPLCDNSVIVIGRKGSIDQPMLIEEPNWVIDTAYYCIPEENIDIHWLYHLLFHKGLAKYNEGSTLPSLSRPTIESIKIWIPVIKEQQKISGCLSVINKSIYQYEMNKQILQQQKQGLMQRLLSGQLRVKP